MRQIIAIAATSPTIDREAAGLNKEPMVFALCADHSTWVLVVKTSNTYPPTAPTFGDWLRLPNIPLD